jgi:Uma2 family endonuclease
MTYEEFLNWEGDNPNVEWVEGKVVSMSPVTEPHADLAVWLSSLLRHFVEAHDSGRILCDPFQMKTGPSLPGRAPDILFLAKPNLGRLKRLHVDGPADLVVEIISPGSRAVDRGEKFFEYERGGVQEYWLLDPERKQAEFYQRGQDGTYRLVGADAGDVYHSRVLDGFWLKVEWLWREPLPPMMSVLKKWKLV